MKINYFTLTLVLVFLQFKATYSQEILSIVKENNLVFDVGANMGFKTDLYLQKGAQVICFEPQPKYVNILNLKYKNNPNVKVEPIGLANFEGVLELHIATAADTLSTFSQQWMTDGRFADDGVNWDQKVTVPVSTLDQAIKKHGRPNFIKIDVEGFEYDVLQGLSSNSDYLSFEFTQEHMENIEKCLDILEARGFKKFNFAIGENLTFALENWLSRPELIVAIKKEIEDRGLVLAKSFWGDIYAQYNDII